MKAVRLSKTTHKGRRGVLTFEWILIFTVLVIGIVGGMSAVRDATVVEFGGVAGAVGALNPEYTVKEFRSTSTADYAKDITAPGMEFKHNGPIGEGGLKVMAKVTAQTPRPIPVPSGGGPGPNG